MIEIANEPSSSNHSLATLEPAGIPARIDEVHAIWPEALVSVSTAGGSYPSQAIAEKVDWVSFHGNGLSASTLTTRVTRAKGDPPLLGAPVVVTEDLWGHADDLASSVLAPVADPYELNPNLEAAPSAGAGWGSYEQGCEGGEGAATEEYDDSSLGEPAENHYRNGFQSLPVDWSMASGEGAKLDFFSDVAL